MKSSAYEEKQKLYKKAREEMEQLYSMGETEKSAATCFLVPTLVHVDSMQCTFDFNRS